MILEKPWMRYAGNRSCCYLFDRYFTILSHVSMGMSKDKDNVLNLGDASPVIGSCPGHPGSSHEKRISIDLDYLTHETNCTQYGIMPLTELWSDDGDLLPVFDWERNYILWTGIRELAPKAKVMTDQRILDYMYDNIKAKYGGSAANDFFRMMDGTAPGQYKHDTHAHVNFE